MRWWKIRNVSVRKVNLSRRDFLESADHTEYCCLAAPARSKQGDKLAMFYFSTEVDYGFDAPEKGLADVGQDDVELRHNGVTVVGLLIQSFGGGEYQVPDRFEWHLIDHAALIKFSQ